MNTSFKKGKEGKYITVEYITDVKSIPCELSTRATQWCLSDEDADKYISTAQELEKLMLNYLVVQKLNHNVCFIILTYANVIENISSGLDIRSNVPLSDLARNFVDTYNNKFNEALNFCLETKKYALKNAKESYTKDYKLYDKHNDYVRKYSLGDDLLILDEHFEQSLKSLVENTKKLLELMKNRLDV